MIQTLTALAEPNRLAIVELLRDGPRSVGDIVDRLGLSQPLVSKHLKVLSDVAIVDRRVDGKRRIYALEQQRFAELDRWLDTFAALWDQRLDRLQAHLDRTEIRAVSELLVSKNLEDREIVLERELRGSVDAVWRSWTTIAALEAWWGPEGWSTTVRALDVRPGGLWHFGMGPAGAATEVWIRAVYTEVIQGSVLSYVEGFSDETGADLDPESHAVTVEFFGVDPALTRLVLRTRFTSVERLEHIAAMGMVEGWAGGFDRLDQFLRSTP